MKCAACERPKELCVCTEVINSLGELEAYRRLISYWLSNDGSSDIDRDVLCDLSKVFTRGV